MKKLLSFIILFLGFNSFGYSQNFSIFVINFKELNKNNIKLKVLKDSNIVYCGDVLKNIDLEFYHNYVVFFEGDGISKKITYTPPNQNIKNNKIYFIPIKLNINSDSTKVGNIEYIQEDFYLK